MPEMWAENRGAAGTTGSILGASDLCGRAPRATTGEPSGQDSGAAQQAPLEGRSGRPTKHHSNAPRASRATRPKEGFSTTFHDRFASRHPRRTVRKWTLIPPLIRSKLGRPLLTSLGSGAFWGGQHCDCLLPTRSFHAKRPGIGPAGDRHQPADLSTPGRASSSCDRPLRNGDHRFWSRRSGTEWNRSPKFEREQHRIRPTPAARHQPQLDRSASAEYAESKRPSGLEWNSPGVPEQPLQRDQRDERNQGAGLEFLILPAARKATWPPCKTRISAGTSPLNS